jgi:hypothetical protein
MLVFGLLTAPVCWFMGSMDSMGFMIYYRRDRFHPVCSVPFGPSPCAVRRARHVQPLFLASRCCASPLDFDLDLVRAKPEVWLDALQL